MKRRDVTDVKFVRARQLSQIARELEDKAKKRSDLHAAADAMEVVADAWEEAGQSQWADEAAFRAAILRRQAQRRKIPLGEAVRIAQRQGWIPRDYHTLPSSELARLSELRQATQWTQGASSVDSGRSVGYAFHLAFERALRRQGTYEPRTRYKP